MNKYIAFIPARCGSKSIKLKNIKKFCGKPLIYWNLIALQNSTIINEVYVATDCEEIKKTVDSFNLSKVKVYMRDPENAQDTSSTESVMLEFIDKSNFSCEDYFVLVQATSPFTQSKDFEKAIRQYHEEQADSLMTCVRTKSFFWDHSNKPVNYDYMNRPRRQDFEGLYMENGAFYINTIKNIKKYENRLSGKISIYEMPEFTGIDIDEEDDWLIAEVLMKKYVISNNPKSMDSRVNIKLFITDVDGVLTDAGMYYSEVGDELKKFNTIDGKGIELLRSKGIPTAILTSENTKIVNKRARKLKIDYLYQDVTDKLMIAKKICVKEHIGLDEVAYIGDDINDIELLQSVGLAACPANAVEKVKSVANIIRLEQQGGQGAVREFIEMILTSNLEIGVMPGLI